MTNIKQRIKDLNDDPKSYRMRVIAPIVSLKKDANGKNSKERVAMIKQVAAEQCLSVRTIERWVDQYEQFGLQGLEPKYKKFRSDIRRFISFESLLDEAIVLRRQCPTISVVEIIKCLEEKHQNIKGIIKRSTLQRHLQQKGFSRGELLREREKGGTAFFGAYRKKLPMEQVQADIKIAGKSFCVNELGMPVTPYIHLWMDNASRMILVATISDTQDNSLVLSSFRELVTGYGIPMSILTDQGSVYKSAAMEHCTSTLGVPHKRSKPYKPQSKGAIERLNGTLDKVLKQLEGMNNVKLSMVELLVKQWVAEYNETPHSALTENMGTDAEVTLSPKEYFYKYIEPVARPVDDIVNLAFTMEYSRKVLKDGVIHIKGRYYKLPANSAKSGEYVVVHCSLVGNSVELVQELTEEEKKESLSQSMYKFIPLYEREIKENIDFTERASDRSEDMPQSLPDEIKPTIQRLARRLYKDRDLYTTEKDFEEQLRKELFHQGPASYSTEPGNSSLYNKSSIKTDEDK